MSTTGNFNLHEISKSNKFFSPLKSTIETAFYGNNVKKISNVKEAYEYAKNCQGIIITDHFVFEPEKSGLPKDARVLLCNSGAITGRNVAARRIRGENSEKNKEIDAIVRDAIFRGKLKPFLKTDAVIGLDEEFMVKAHLMLPESESYLMYSWLLNFQFFDDEFSNKYKNSVKLNDADIFVFVEPTWTNLDYPDGLAYFDTQHNVLAILGMSYFGELKKGTLTLAWATANRNGYVACHAGLKNFTLSNGNYHTAAFFGLSGSGKSTLTHAKHGNKYNITVLHDDAYIINCKNGSSIALEPSYFDKTADYSAENEDNKFIITAQNLGATLDNSGNIVLVPEDIRNANGRAIKSKLWSKNRVNKINTPITSVFWLMKDPTFPPVVKINNPELAATMGLTLTTKRTTAETLKNGQSYDSLVVEPYANPFRIYPLEEDYKKFKGLFDDGKVKCYILNTGDFLGKKVSANNTLSCIEKIVEENAKFVPFGNLSDMEILDFDEFMPDFTSKDYLDQIKDKFLTRILFLENKNDKKNNFDFVPESAINCLRKKVSEIF